ncbi:MAG: hypothetical protein Q9165_006384 [Trypethelium subeluteriae]
MAPLEDESAPEADEPPDERPQLLQMPSNLKLPSPTCGSFEKTGFPPTFQRRESLLTQALHFKEPDNAPVHIHPTPTRILSRVPTSSAWSNTSNTSAAELTSDDGFTSPGLRTNSPSPPLPATSTYSLPSLNSKSSNHGSRPPTASVNDSISISSETNDAPTERAVEATLGRKRCIKFACGRKESPSSPPPQEPVTEEPTRPERKSMLRFICPKRCSPPREAPVPDNTMAQRPAVQIPLPAAGSPKGIPIRPHRDSDSTVKNDSPRTTRKNAAALARKKYEEDSDLGHTSATRFHEFASSEEEVDDWVQESTCHRSRLTVNDTLGKENIIRQLGREAEEEEEALDEEEIIDNEPQNDEEDEDQEDDDEDDEEDDDEDEDEEEDRISDRESESELEPDDEAGNSEIKEHVSDDGFQTDDENGFASTDEESDTNSDYHWWTPGRSTAATSTEHLEHIRPLAHRNASSSSIGSVGSSNSRRRSPHPNKLRRTSHSKTGPVDIENNVAPDLPDSTDFVCGTLDEDRPLERAYMTRMEQRKAAKHKAIPQDIDPSFPTSDPEMDEEDEDEDKNEAADEGDYPFFPGRLEIHDTEGRGRSVSEWRKSSSRTSPPVSKQSSPPKRSTARSPPPPAKHTVHRSPPPPKRCGARSPPPPSRRLFGQSPKRLRSPPPTRRLRSPPPSRRNSFDKADGPTLDTSHLRLAQRPQLIHTASLPHTPYQATKALATYGDDLDGASDNEIASTTTPTTRSRGAIDIVKGLEKKRQLRKEKLYQKYCSRVAAAGGKDKEKRPKPGKGCERMRQLGLEAAAYRGKRAGEGTQEQKEPHMLSL